VTHVLKSVRGEELTKMKNMLNDVGNRFSLHQVSFCFLLVYCTQ
jgi:hypothetical protein